MTEKVNKIQDTENVYDAQKSDQALEVNVTAFSVFLSTILKPVMNDSLPEISCFEFLYLQQTHSIKG